MKLKTSPQYSLNQFFRLSLFIGLGIFLSKASISRAQDDVPGIIESLEKLQKLQQDQFLKSKPSANVISKEELQSSIEIKIDPYYMKGILFQSDTRYLALVQKDECRFYSLLEKNLIKNSDETIESIRITIKDSEGKSTSGSIDKVSFFEEIYKRKCLSNKEYKILFNEANFAKTISTIKFPVPKGENDCKLIHGEWLTNSYTPYLCAINTIIKSASSLNKDKLSEEESGLYKAAEKFLIKIPLLQRNYIDNLCSHLNDPEPFCSNYLKSDIWSKVINGEAPTYKLNYKCEASLKSNSQISLLDQKKCAALFLTKPYVCSTDGINKYPAFFPMQNCDDVSLALNHSKLVTSYHDCPANIDNEAITNVHRIINHFSPRKIEPGSENCAGEANYSFAKLNLDIKHEQGWPLKICYKNLVENKEKCTLYIPGSRPEEPLSEDQVIAKILYLNKNAPPKTKCRIISSKKYNPIRSEFKNGCFVVYNADKCTTLACEKKVIWEEKEQKDIRFIGSPSFEYYPSAFSNERYAVQNMLYEVKGIQSRSIKNVTDLKFYLDKINSSIIHGIGCSEDLLPEIFTRSEINKCHPIPFIIDGYLNNNGEIFLITRTAIDDLYSPRTIHWSNVYNSVSAYKELHPLNSWTLHGLKK